MLFKKTLTKDQLALEIQEDLSKVSLCVFSIFNLYIRNDLGNRFYLKAGKLLANSQSDIGGFFG